MDLGYDEKFTVLDSFRYLIADPLYSPASLWGQVDPVYYNKEGDTIAAHPEKGLHFARNIVLLYHIGLQAEAYYLWNCFKKQRVMIKDQLSTLTEKET